MKQKSRLFKIAEEVSKLPDKKAVPDRAISKWDLYLPAFLRVKLK